MQPLLYLQATRDLRNWARFAKRYETLSDREKSVLAAYFLHEEAGKAALSIDITASTFRTHLKNIKQKLGKYKKAELLYVQFLKEKVNVYDN